MLTVYSNTEITMLSVMSVKSLTGSIVTINPGDTHLKRGEVIQVSSFGVLFRITESTNEHIHVGDTLFISWATGLTMLKR